MIEELLFLAVPYGLAFVLALLLPFFALVQYRLAARVPADVRLIFLLVMVTIGALVSVAFDPRDLNENVYKSPFVYATDSAAGYWVSRVFNVLVLGVAVVELARGCRESLRSSQPDPARSLVLGVLLFYFGTPLVQAVGSDHPNFTWRSLYVPIVVMAVCLLRIERTDRILTAAKWCIFACTFGSLMMALLRPGFALATPYDGFLPGIKFRLFGLAPHANALGPIAVVGLLLEMHSPSPRRMLRWAHLASAFGVLLLAQSKTAWVAAVLMAIVTWVPLNLLPAKLPQLQAKAFSRATFTLIGAALVVAVLAIAAVLFDIVGFFQRNDSLLTFTGRINIWEITLSEWRKNIFFGYGPELWGVPYRRALNMLHAGQAHNQFVQSIGDSGLIGLAALLYYLGVLFATGVRCFRASHGLVLALVILMISRCVTEAALRTDALLSWTTFITLLAVVFGSYHLRQSSSAMRAPTPTPEHAFAMPLRRSS